MRIQAIVKSGGLWMPWHGELPEGTLLELDVVEVMPNKSEDLPILHNIPNITLPNENVAEFKQLTDALFGEGYHYVPEKSDQEILAEVLSDKYA